MKHTVLLIGSGGRECALAWKLHESPHVHKLYIAPGNAGTKNYGENVPLQATDIPALCDFAVSKKVSFVIVGPDDPLMLGMVDAFQALEIPVFGPTRSAAQLEWSKAFAKEAMQSARVPTAPYRTCNTHDEALTYLDTQQLPVVIKASGLALGKGVYICHSKEEAHAALKEIMIDKLHKDAGNAVVIEAFLVGREISAHCLTDGHTHIHFPPAQDHKRVGNGNSGKNTGGMGTIAPLPWVDRETEDNIKKHIVEPTLQYMQKEGSVFTGCLFPGLMVTPTGTYTLEFNARFGDPETQVYMRLLESDLIELLYAVATHTLHDVQPRWRAGYAANIVLASGGYPDAYEKGKLITGIDVAERMKDVVVFHAGTTELEGKHYTNGGRVLGVSATGATLSEALDTAYKAVSCISFEGMQYRTDIGKESLA
ncbi:MAG: hypothetical protein RI911_896 [Candidatus Parcubacteria bacterium]|jgi:phosphoribosylamine--glycine ligase